MTVPELISKLNLPHATVSALAEVELPENYSALKSSFFNKTPFFTDFAGSDATGISVLKLYLNWASEFSVSNLGLMAVRHRDIDV